MSKRNFYFETEGVRLILRSKLKVMSPYSPCNIYGADNKYHWLFAISAHI
jgi:hypothetical protein